MVRSLHITPNNGHDFAASDMGIGYAVSFLPLLLSSSLPLSPCLNSSSSFSLSPAEEIQRCPELTLSSEELSKEFNAHSHYVPVPLGTDFSVQCTCVRLISSSEPQWILEGRNVTRDITNSLYQNVGVRQSELVIKNFTVELAGRYICQDYSVESDFYLIPVDSVRSEY